MIKPRSRFGSFRWPCARMGRKQRIDCLVSKSRHTIMHKITANHSVGQPLLVFLINHPAVGSKILLAPAKKFSQRDFLFDAPTLCMPNANDSFGFWGCEKSAFNIIHRQLDFPDADSAVTSVLLEHPRFAFRQTRRQFLTHLFHAGVQMGVATPPNVAGSV